MAKWSHRIDLSSGSIEATFEYDLNTITDQDREMLFWVMDRFRDFELQRGDRLPGVEPREGPARSYPHESGDVTVLGPGVFVADDGSVLNWDGENYVPQPPNPGAVSDV